MNTRRPERRGLGRGLSALMADVGVTNDDGSVPPAPRRADMSLPLDLLHPNPDQPRRSFAAEAMAELADSIRARGVIQPLIVRNHPTIPGHYEIVAGERRWRAAQEAQRHNVPVVIRDLTDSEVLELAIIENIQRADLNAIEEAQGYRQLMDRFGHTQDMLAAALSKSRSHVANLLRLLQLPEQVQTWLRDGRLTAGHARALITAENPVELGLAVIARGLSVRETEKLARAAGGAARRPRAEARQDRAAADAETRVLEQDISATLKMKVVIDHRGHDGGNLVITYRTLDQLDQLCQILGRGA